MKQIVELQPGERSEVFNEAGATLGLPPSYVEKDFWVCWTLGVLFGDPVSGQHLTFRGGTSLSKGWGLIRRFSEDIDLAMARVWVEAKLPDPGEAGINTAERDRRFKRLRDACRQAIRDKLYPLLTTEVAKLGGEAKVELEDLDQARDPFVIKLHYPKGAIKAPGDYSQAVVKIELSGRADDWPQEARGISPYVFKALPQLGKSDPVNVQCVLPRRTFWEKAALLHEQHTRPEAKALAVRQARHLYDLVQLWESVSKDAELVKLFPGVMMHRQAFYGYSWVNYAKLKPGDLKLAPPEDRMRDWRLDYQAMATMFFEEPPEFDRLVASLREIKTKLGAL